MPNSFTLEASKPNVYLPFRVRPWYSRTYRMVYNKTLHKNIDLLSLFITNGKVFKGDAVATWHWSRGPSLDWAPLRILVALCKVTYICVPSSM